MSDQITFDQWAQDKIEKIEELSKTKDNNEQGGWFNILKQIITAADIRTTTTAPKPEEKIESGECIYADYADDNESFQANDIKDQFSTKTVKWTIRVKAFQLVHRLVPSLESKHLPDLVRLAFVSATSPYDELKLEGFKMFEYIINRFASVEEREFRGHSIIEQYKTQVISAINPALDLEAPPYITAIASRLLCLWICRNLETDATGLKRIYQLTMKTLTKLDNQSTNQNSKLYTESELEQERLDILGSWAQIYVKSIELENLNCLIKPEVASLIDKWWEALKDYALLIIPKSSNADNVIMSSSMKIDQPIYTSQVALGLFSNVWFKLIAAVSYWLHQDAPNDPSIESAARAKYFKFICGIMMKEFCGHSKGQLTEPTRICIKSLNLLLNDEFIKQLLLEDVKLTQEFYIILYSILIGLNRGTQSTQLTQCLELLFNIYIQSVISHDQNEIKIITERITKAIANNLNQLAEAIDSPNNCAIDKLTIKINLNIRISCLLGIYKKLQESIIEDGMKQNLITILRTIISFKNDIAIKNILLQTLSEFNYSGSEQHLGFIRESLYTTKIEVLSSYLSTYISSSSHNKSEIDYQMTSLIHDIKVKRDDLSNEILTCLLQSIATGIPKTTTDESSSTKIADNKSDFRFELYQRLKSELADLFNECIDKNLDLKNTYATIVEMHRKQELASEKVAQNDEKLKKTQQTGNSSSKMNTKPKTKIILKTDFGNFYSNKPSK